MTSSEIRSAVGVLLWPAGSMRSGIAMAVNMTARHLNTPTENHLCGMKHILRFLQGTVKHGIKLIPNKHDKFIAELFCDADWAGDQTLIAARLVDAS